MQASGGYSRLSIIVHWIAAICVVALFFTHEGNRDSLSFAFHVSGGAVIGVFLIWRVLYRTRRGFASKPDQHVLLNLVSKLVLWGLLISILAVTVTGYLLPWSVGQPISFGGLFDIPSPLPRSRPLHELMEQVHDLAGHVIVPLFLLHVLGAMKHLIINRDGVMQRMIRSDEMGR